MKKFDGFEFSQENLSGDDDSLMVKIDKKRIRDSYELGAVVSKSDASRLSYFSFQDESFRKIRSKPSRQTPTVARPLSVLKTTFFDNLTNLPKSILNEKRILSQNRRKSEQSFTHKKRHPSTNNDELLNLETKILQKDALIETLRTRVSQLIEELEKTRHKASSPTPAHKNDFQLLDLQHKYESFELTLQNFYSTEKDLNLCLDKKDEEIQILTKELRSARMELENRAEHVKKIESEIESAKCSKEIFESRIESLNFKLESSAKALELVNSHKSHLEQEFDRLETKARLRDKEIKTSTEDHNRILMSLENKIEDAKIEASKYKTLWRDSVQAYESLQFSNDSLTNKLQYLENELSQLSKSRISLKENQNLANLPQNHSENLTESFFSNKKTLSKEQTNEIFEILCVNNPSEVISALKKLQTSEKEKKLTRKIINLVKSCLGKDSKISCSQVWKFIKNVFEQYAKLVQDYGNEINLLRQYFGSSDLIEKLLSMNQEHKKLNKTLL